MSEPSQTGPRPRKKRPEGEVRPKGAHNTSDDSTEKRISPARGRAPRRDDARPSRPRRDDSSSGRSESRSPSRAPRRDDARPPRRDDSGGGRPRAARPEGWRTEGDRPARAPRRDDARAPRRDDARPSGPRPSRSRTEGDRPTRAPRRDDARPSGPRRDDRPRRPRTEGDRPTRAPRRDDARAPRRDDRPSGPRRDDRPSRPRTEGDRPTRAPRRDDARPSGPRPSRPRTEGDRPTRAPRRDDARPSRPRTEGDRPTRAPRRDDARAPRRDDRPSGPRRDDRPSRPRTEGDRPSGQWQSRPRPTSDRTSRGGPKGPRRDSDKPARPQTAKERKSLEVKRRTGGRRTTDAPTGAANHVDEQWIDEGSVMPARAQKRARTDVKVSRGGTKAVKAMSPVVSEFEKSFGSTGSAKYLRRYEVALQAFEEHRYTEARIILTPLARECSDVGAVRELHALCLYREESWHKAIIEFEAVIEMDSTNIFNHAVLADCHRAVGEHDRVDELWTALRAASPNPELLAEGRIVYAGSLAERGHVEDAILVMTKVAAAPKKVREYHMREWYVLANLLDKSGDVVKARKVFEQIAAVDVAFADVAERLSTLGS